LSCTLPVSRERQTTLELAAIFRRTSRYLLWICCPQFRARPAVKYSKRKYATVCVGWGLWCSLIIQTNWYGQWSDAALRSMSLRNHDMTLRWYQQRTKKFTIFFIFW
jgi:hypothetical protein